MENEIYKILIVDDLPKNIMVLGNNLINSNYQIAYARSGAEAIKLTETNDFDLILLDIMMPGMDGYETCKRILTNPKTSLVPIIFITAKNDYESIVKGFEVGAKDYVTKPFNSKELLARVKTHLELKRSREKLEQLNANLEQKVLERTNELKKANEKLKRLDSAKSSFLGIISHEIRTPLNGIFGSVEILSDMHPDEDTQDIIQMLSESAERLLTFSELSTLITELNIDQYKLNKSKINLFELANLVKKEAISNYSGNQNININIDIPEKEECIEADDKLLKKIISDVVHNSIRFGENSVNINIQLQKEEDQVSIHITDNGKGFPKHILPFVLEVFQADSKNYVEGKGLNLAAAKLIMEAHNGQIEVGNHQTGGACVILRFLKIEG